MNHYAAHVLFCFILCINTNTIPATETEEIEHNELNQTQIINGQSAIFLDKEKQKISGLQTLKVKNTEFQPEFIAFGKAISISPLLSILNQHISASAKQASAKARFSQTKKNISRLRDLHKNEVVSTRKLQEQQSKWQSDKAIYDENVYQSMIIISKSRLLWGEKLTQWATGIHSPIFEKLIEGQSTLIQITLPAGKSLPLKTSTIYISSTGDRSKAFEISFVSKIPKVNSLSQGLQYIFLSDNSSIQTGMNFTAWIPQQNQNKTGVIIPESSLAWHLGQSFVFIKANEEYFIHRNIVHSIKMGKGYFIQNQIAEGEKVVTTGTQMLLSHEFRSLIPDEDDD